MIIVSQQRINATQNKDITIKIRDVVKSLGVHIGRQLLWLYSQDIFIRF